MRGNELLLEAWTALGLPEAPPEVVVEGTTGLGSPLPVGHLAVGAVATQLAAAGLLTGRTGGPIRIDAAHVGVAFRSERYVRLGGRPAGAGFAPLSRFWRTADGWLRLHANYPQHRAAALRVLGSGDDEPDHVGRLVEDWRAEPLESAVVEAGGAAAAVRTERTWSAHPQGAAVAAEPLLRLERVADGAPRSSAPAGLRVLDLTRVIAGPVATRTLASYGADVLRVDTPAMPDDRGGLLDTGAGKRHVDLDLDTAGDRRAVEELLAGADVVVQGYRPGALDRFGLDPIALTDRHPHLVVVRLSAWGATGPWGGRRGFDSLVQAASGIAVACGADGEPGTLPAQALDHATGHLAAATVLAALVRQRAEGGGWHGELSLARTAHWLRTADRAHSEVPVDDVDPGPYLVDLPSHRGVVTLVRPPGSPVWAHAARFPGETEAAWLPRQV
jgi:crotonobetainyl-CoA:carnitine CoA-transferase CaiB-like acyl-CoA transferase